MINPIIIELRIQPEWTGEAGNYLPILYKWIAAGSGSGRMYDMILTRFDVGGGISPSIGIRSEDISAGSTIYDEYPGLLAVDNWPSGDNWITVEVGRAEPRVSHPDSRKPYEDWNLVPTSRKTVTVRVTGAPVEKESPFSFW